MAFWTGVNQGYKAHKANVLAEKNIQLSEEELDLRKRNEARADAQFEEQVLQNERELALQLRKDLGIVSTGSSNTRSGTNTKTSGPGLLENNIATLKKTFNIEDAQIAKVHGAGGAASIAELVKVATKLRTDYDSGEYFFAQPFNEILGSVLSDAIYTADRTELITPESLAKRLGTPEVSATIVNIVGNERTIPGATNFPEVTRVKVATAAELKDLKDLAAGEVSEQAIANMQQARTFIADVAEKRRTDPDNLSELEKITSSWLVNYNMDVGNALQDATKNKLYTPLLTKFGFPNVSGITDYFKKTQGAPLTVFNNLEVMPLDLTRYMPDDAGVMDQMPMLSTLKSLGIIQTGQQVILMAPRSADDPTIIRRKATIKN